LSAEYHLGELEVARDPTHPGHVLPPPTSPGNLVLDVGCGAGQTLIAAYPDQDSFGIDVDLAALELGRSLASRITFVQGRAEALPFANGQFDLVVARVSLAYTSIPQSLKEIRRVLKPGGKLWMALHTFAVPWEAARRSNWRGKIFFGYIVVNSLLFHLVQREFALLGRHESFQTEHGMRRALQRIGFSEIQVTHQPHFVITARAGGK
jgi:ubiquinone/menaquinone biosynthesis C-methylase UbiE